MTLLERQGAFAGPRGKTISMLSQLTISESLCCVALTNSVGLSLGVFLPPAIAYFPQKAVIKRDQLEPEYRAEAETAPVYFNKGL